MDDPWYQSFVPRVRVAPRAAKHTRRASLLQQPNVSPRAHLGQSVHR